MEILLAVRRFFCTAPGCKRKTFAEQVDGLTTRYARKTPLLAGALGSVAVAKTGRAGSRLAARLTDLTGQDLPHWMATAREAGLPGISSFAKGLEQDLDAVTNGLTKSWSSGPVGGRVTTSR